MAELTKQDLMYILETILLNFEGKPLTELISQISPKHILVGAETLKLIKEQWQL